MNSHGRVEVSGDRSDALRRGEPKARLPVPVSAPPSLRSRRCGLRLFTQLSLRHRDGCLGIFSQFAPAVLYGCVGVLANTAQRDGSSGSVAAQRSPQAYPQPDAPSPVHPWLVSPGIRRDSWFVTPFICVPDAVENPLKPYTRVIFCNSCGLSLIRIKRRPEPR